MNVQTLRLIVTDGDLAILIREHLGEQDGIEKLEAKILSEGVRIQGEVATGFGFKVPFETTWEMSAAGAEVQARLGTVRVAGVPGGMLRGVLFRMIRDAAEGRPGIRVDDGCVNLDVVALTGQFLLELQICLTSIEMRAGEMVIHAGC